MNIAKCLSSVDSICANKVKSEDKIEWLSELDGKITEEVLALYGTETFTAYDPDRDLDKDLKIKEPYSGIYILYLCSKIYLMLGDMEKYAAYNMLYKDSYEELCRAYNHKFTRTKNTNIRGL